MAKKWSDVAASAAFQALSFEEQEEARRQYFDEVVSPQVPEADRSLARDQFFADTAPRKAAASAPAMAPLGNPMGDDFASSIPATSAPPDNRGIIQRIGEFLRPAPKGSVLDQPYTPTPEERQAEIDKRLSYGAGPISREAVTAADAVRSSRGTRQEVQPQSPVVEKIVNTMDERRERSSADILSNLPSTKTASLAAAQRKSEEWRTVGEWAADTLSNVSQGVVSLAQLPVNIIAPSSSLADTLRETQKELQAQESEVLRAQRELLKDRVESEDGFLGKYFATVQSLVTNPALSISEAVKQIPNFMAVVGAARLVGSAAGAGVSAVGRVAPTVALGEAISGGALQTSARILGTRAGGLSASMVLTAGDAAGNTYDELVDPKKTDPKLFKDNPDYQRLLLEKLSKGRTETQARALIEQVQKDAKNPNWFPEDTPGGEDYNAASKQAIQEIATAKARMAALITAPLGALGFMGAEAAVASRGLGRAAAAAMTPKGIAKMFAKENIGEQLEEGGTQLGSNIVTRTVNPNQSLTEGVPEAMATAAITSAPYAAAGARSQYLEAAAGQPRDVVAERVAAERMSPDFLDPTKVRPQDTARTTNFTPPDSPTKQAGLVDIEVPLPGAEALAPLGPINPTTEQQFGLDKLRMGGANVSTSGIPGDLAGQGSGSGGGVAGGSLGAAGPGTDSTAGLGGGAAGVVRADDQSTVPPGGSLDQQPAGVNQPPVKIWAGRAGDGYAQPADAQQALPKLQSRYPDLTWNLQQDADGKYFWAGTNTAAAGTQAAATQPAVGQAVTGAAETGAAATAAATKLPDLESAGLRLAPTAPVRHITQLNKALQNESGITISPVSTADLSDQHRLASTVARLLGKTLTVVRQETGNTSAMPNGMINRLGGKDIFIAENTDDAPLFVAVHEAYHGLPEDKRSVLNAALLETFKLDMKDEFLREFSYDPKKFDEEAPAMIAQAVSKREDFWQDLRSKMGNKEFGEVAKVILTKLGEIVTGAKKQYGDDFVNKYISDIAKARDLLSTAYADSMREQGLKPEVQLETEVMASERSRVDMNFKDVIKRTPELQAAAEKVKAGEMTAPEYDKLVNEFKPVEPYKSAPAPAADAEIRTALTSDKTDRIGVPSRTLKAGDPVGLRLDIPAYANHGTWVVSVHEQESGYNAGKSIGYEPVAAATNVTFGVVEKAAMNIATGKPKATIAVIKGGWKPTTPAQAKIQADQALKSKDWVQVGMDPERHSYFYDRKTMEPVVSADEVIQVGPLVLAKNPTYGDKADFMFSKRAENYDPKQDNFKAPDTTEVLQKDVVDRANKYVARYYSEKPEYKMEPQDRAAGEQLLAPSMKLAQEAKPQYDQKILDIAERTGALGQQLAPIKNAGRAVEKMHQESVKLGRGMDPADVKDLLRSTIVVNSYGEADAVIGEIEKEFDVVRLKDRRSDVERDKQGGYGDVLMNVRMPNGTMAEIQVNVPAMLAAKSGQGHKLYEAARVHPEGSAKYNEVMGAMRELYDAAFLRAKNSRDLAQVERKPASDMGAALRSGRSPAGTSVSPSSEALNTLPSGNLTNSSPENEATKTQPSGNLSGTRIGVSPDATNISQNLYADKAATKDEIVVDGVMFSNRQRDLESVPTIELKDLVDKKVFGIKADLMDAGRSYTGIDGSQLMFPVEMMGGPNYPRLKTSQKQRTIWAVRGGAVLSKIQEKVKKADYVLVVAMNNNSHLTNSTATEAYIKTVEAYLRDGRISKDNLLALDAIVRSPKNKLSLKDFPGFESAEIIKYIDGLSFDQRGALAKILEKKEAQAHGLPNLDKFRRETLDPDYAGYRQGDAMLVLEVDKQDSTIKLGENGTKMHPAYPLALRGRVVGKLAKGVNYETIFRDYFKFAVPNFKNKEQGAWYAFDRKMPVQKITAEIASAVAPGEFKAIQFPRQAEAALAMANGNWLVSGKTKAVGGVSVQEFVDALAANDGAAALTLYTAKEVNAGIKDKSFRVYQLGSQGGDKGLKIFFGLKRGRPWYADMIEGVGDNEVEVVSVTNNEPGAPGVGVPAIITKAISEGATVLDAFAVKSKRFPKGFLPEMYGQFGFEEIGRIPFDPSYYNENQLKDLRAFWSKGGWKESDGYPDVVVMRWKGKDEDRATAVERYVRSGETSVSQRAARFDGSPTKDAHGQRDQSRAQQRGRRGADSGTARGNQGAGNAAPVVRRAYGSIQEIASLSDGDIRNLGLKPEEVSRLRDFLAQPGAAPASPTSGVQFSKRASPADKIKWREVTTVKSEIGLDRLPQHIVPFAEFMSTMATKAANGGLTARDVIKAYTIARSSMNRGAITTGKARAAGLKLPAGFSDEKIRPEGAFGYWLLSPMGQRYLNAAEVGITDQAAVDDAVKVMAPFGTQNTLGEDLKRAASGDLHVRLPGLTAAIAKAAKGENAVQEWQDALDNLYGVREAKKGFLGSLLGFGQLPTFDARQINANVERESKDDTLRALSSTKARDVVATLAKRMDALSLTMDPRYKPFYQHLAHHAVWDAVGGTETTHEDVVDSMLMASNRAQPSVKSDKELASLFKDLQESRGLGRIRVQERVDAHPMAATITKIDSEFYDILDRLESAGLVNINCK